MAQFTSATEMPSQYILHDKGSLACPSGESLPHTSPGCHATSPPSQVEQKYRKTNSQLDLRMRPKVHYFLQGGASQALCPKETGTERTTQRRRLSPWLPCYSGYHAYLTGISPQGKSAAHPPPAPEPAPTPQVPIHPQSRASGFSPGAVSAPDLSVQGNVSSGKDGDHLCPVL